MEGCAPIGFRDARHGAQAAPGVAVGGFAQGVNSSLLGCFAAAFGK
jgi:hypothetical protein